MATVSVDRIAATPERNPRVLEGGKNGVSRYPAAIYLVAGRVRRAHSRQRDKQWSTQWTTNSEEKNKTLVLEAFDTLFNKRGYKEGEVLVAELHST
jgi:hypothetical protein